MKQIILLFLTATYQIGNVITINRLIDLTWTFNNKSIAWGDNKRFEYTKVTVVEEPNGVRYTLKEFAVAEHCGTHLDPPFHFNPNGWSVDEIPLTHLVTTGIKIDLSKETEKLGPKARLLPKHLIDWERRHGPIPNKSVVLVSFNWSQYYHDPLKYLGGTEPTSYNHPGISPEAARWIVNKKKIVGVGTDTASFDPSSNFDLDAHRLFLFNQIYGLENVKIPQDLPEGKFNIYCLPMLLGEGTGAPTRIVASLPYIH